MNTQGTQKIVILLGVLILLVFFGYSFFVKDSGVVDSSIVQSNTVEGEDILALVETLKKITIEKTLFTSALFLGLKDYSVSLNPEQQGRPNPFANIGADANIPSKPQSNNSKVQ